ncbi:LacI family DNA-binding transcriptional regulator [Microlunatus sp. Gsoil 973]|uniref:LacI family DNA-binding transcriptional regulator n=1 Tax=Microlunatus sp. Gsoil 973 TaxID=2672569 RepID=UPI0018A813A7|nr:LacI family DNA-binding transcriptional regulator [Microlunatus sp. Gsoil 973]
MRPRLQDVADHAGVSMKTVSNVINGYQHVSAATRRRVLAAVDALGYRPNLAARNLARGRAGLIALVVPRLDFPYFAALSGRILQAARAVGWEVLIEQTDGDPELERQVIAGHLARRIDGLIFSPVALTAAEIQERTDPTPLVLLGEHVVNAGAPHIAIDNVAAAAQATQHLIDIGCRRIAMVGATRRRDNPRYQGFRQAMKRAALPVEPYLVRPTRSTAGIEGEQQLAAILDSDVPPPDGVFCATDWLALGAIRAIHRHGLRVPQDIAVVGFDAIPYGEVASPSLTTIMPDRDQIARRAVAALLAAHDHPTNPTARDDQAHQPDVDFRLIIRESTDR